MRRGPSPRPSSCTRTRQSPTSPPLRRAFAALFSSCRDDTTETCVPPLAARRNACLNRVRGNLVAIILAGLCALMYGAADFCGGLSTRKSPLVAVLAFSHSVGLVAALGASLFLGHSLPTGTDLAWGAISGVC